MYFMLYACNNWLPSRLHDLFRVCMCVFCRCWCCFCFDYWTRTIREWPEEWMAQKNNKIGNSTTSNSTLFKWTRKCYKCVIKILIAAGIIHIESLEIDWVCIGNGDKPLLLKRVCVYLMQYIEIAQRIYYHRYIFYWIIAGSNRHYETWNNQTKQKHTQGWK